MKELDPQIRQIQNEEHDEPVQENQNIQNQNLQNQNLQEQNQNQNLQEQNLQNQDGQQQNLQPLHENQEILQNMVQNQMPQNMPAPMREYEMLSAFDTEHAAKDILLNHYRGTNDSDLMDKVKKSIRDIDINLLALGSRDYNIKNIDVILRLYDEAMDHCRTYLKKRKSKKQMAVLRQNLVRSNLFRMEKEVRDLKLVKELVTSTVIDEKGERRFILPAEEVSLRVLIAQAKVYYKYSEGAKITPEVENRSLPDEAAILAAGREAELIYRAVSGMEQPSIMIKRLSESKKEEDRALSQILPQIFVEIENHLSNVKEKRADSFNIKVNDKLINFSVNPAGQLRISTGNKTLNVERYAATLFDVLRSEIVSNEDQFGATASWDIIMETLDQAALNPADITKQGLILDYLLKKTEIPAASFSSFGMDSLVSMAMMAKQGLKFAILTKEKYDDMKEKGKLDANTYYYLEDAYDLNITETKNLLKEVSKQENALDVKQKVELSGINPPIPAVGGEQWTEKEKKVQNLIADLFFSYDKLTADELLGAKTEEEKNRLSAERIRKVMLENIESVAELLADSFREGNDHRALVNGILDRMPLFALAEGQAAEIRNTINGILDDIVREVTIEINTVIAATLPEIVYKKEAAEAELKKFEDALEKERQQREEDDEKEELRREEEAKSLNFFEIIARKAYYARVDFAIGVERTKKDADDVLAMAGYQANVAKYGVADTYDKMWKIAMDHITDTKDLLEGSKIRQIPALKDIITNKLSVAKLLRMEERIGNGTQNLTERIQSTVTNLSGELFANAGQQVNEQPLPDENEPGISKNQKLYRKRKRLDRENKKLTAMLKQNMVTGEKGQGHFIKLVFENYFSGVSLIDQRSMISSMIKNAKPIGRLAEIREDMSENEKNTARAHNEKVGKIAKGNYIGGLLKGAGPLFQKMIQGLPTASLPEELKEAIGDMKSKLAPIPDYVVEAQLYDMVKRSHGQIESIKVVKPLGAASVGQTFLCTLTLKGGATREVAIKMIKPDVRNRMLREKKIMLKCARQTDMDDRQNEGLPALLENEKGGMEQTYEGQLLRIEEELDLTIEAKNVEIGKLYDKSVKESEKKVHSMKLSNLVAPTTNTMVLDRAPGETIDGYLSRMNKELNELIDPYKRKDADGKVIMLPNSEGNLEETFYITQMDMINATITPKYPGDHKSVQKYREIFKTYPSYIIKELAVRLADMKKRKWYLYDFCRKWLNEGVFGEGFYHGDPHDGNLMMDENGLTVIDFGNCTQLSKNQQLHVTRMVAAASVGDMEIFRDSFRALLGEDFADLYEQKKDELGAAFSEVLSLGDASSAGTRIAVCLIKAQELGFEVPAAVQNYSQAQLRLANTMDNFNAQIRKMENTIAALDSIVSLPIYKRLDFSDITRETNGGFNKTAIMRSRDATFNHFMNYADSADEFKTIFTEAPEHFYEYRVKPLDQKVKNIDTYADAVKRVIELMMERQGQSRTNYIESNTWKLDLNAQQEACKMALPYGMIEEVEHLIRTGNVSNEQKEEIVQKIKNSKNRYFAAKKKCKEIVKKSNDILKNHKQKFKPTAEEDAAFTTLCSEFRELFLPYQKQNLRYEINYLNAYSIICTKNREEKKVVSTEMAVFFEYNPTYKDEFNEAYNELQDFLTQNAEVPNVNLEEKFRLENKVMDVYQKAMGEYIRVAFKAYYAASDVDKKDFTNVTAGVIKDNLLAAVDRIGIGAGYTIKSKLKAINKEKKKMEQAVIKVKEEGQA